MSHIMRMYEDGPEIPARYEVCDRCSGKGTHVNPAIDGNGITWEDRQDWADDDFMEDYMSGVYDVRCEECGGQRVVSVPDESRCTPEQIQEYESYLADKWAYEAEIAWERRMGC